MLNRFWICVFTVAALLLGAAGCGQKVNTSLESNQTYHGLIEQKNQIVMLPFADYTTGIRPDDSIRRQIKIQSSFSHHLAANGYYVPMEEDTVQYLVDLGVISLIESPEMKSGRSRQTLAREMGTGWSERMQEEIDQLLIHNDMQNVSGERLKFNKVGLHKGTIMQIGRYFNANYVLRGRIVEYDLREGQGLNPLQQGILPFFFDGSSGLIFGVAKSESYDVWQDIAIGGAIGLAAGSTGNTPFNEPSTTSEVTGSHPRDMEVVTSTSGGYTTSEGLNAATWGGVGAGVAYLASKGGYVPKAVVQLSVALQDTKTGQVVWANRVEKEVEPASMWSDPTDRKNIDVAVEEATKELAEDLTAALDQAIAPTSTTVSMVMPSDGEIKMENSMESPEESEMLKPENLSEDIEVDIKETEVENIGS